ncbi:MAG: hybrid sensor histidine kinase/response regulator, partial [Pseudomonas sp.]
MAKPSDPRQQALAGLLGLTNHSVRKSHYPELAARLEELETERNRYQALSLRLQELNDELERRVSERTE